MLVYLLLIMGGSHSLWSQHVKKEDVLTKQLSATGISQVTIRNINGSVEVYGTQEKTIRIEVKRTLYAPTQAKLNKGLEAVQIGAFTEAGQAYVYMDAPWVKLRYHGERETYIWDWENRNHGGHVPYDYQLDFTVYIPQDLGLTVSTVNKGEVHVEKVNAPMDINNVNGGITLTQVDGTSKAHTINGNVIAHFTSIPKQDCRFYTLNGTMKIHYPPSLSAQLDIKTTNGNFFTDYDDFESLPTPIQKIKKTSSGGTRYKIGKSSQYKLGSGGPQIALETFNGDIYLIKNQ